MSNSVVVGIGEFKISNNPDDIIKTFALGSCIAVIMYDTVNRIGGLLHFALPDSNISIEKAEALPGYFADTGIPLLINSMIKKGLNIRNSWIKITGGASVFDESHNFDIGRRNLLACKKILWKYNMGVKAEETGGVIPRTVYLNVSDGEVILSNSNKKWNL